MLKTEPADVVLIINQVVSVNLQLIGALGETVARYCTTSWRSIDSQGYAADKKVNISKSVEFENSHKIIYAPEHKKIN